MPVMSHHHIPRALRCPPTCRYQVSLIRKYWTVDANLTTAMMPSTPAHASYVAAPGPAPHSYPTAAPFDTTGQIAPPGMKPRVTATLWEDEGSLCFQVEAKGVCVARREGEQD